MKKISKVNTKILFGYAVLIMIVSLSWVTGSFFINSFRKDVQKTADIQTKKLPSQFPDYDAIKGERSNSNIHVLNITSDCLQDGCVNNNPATIEFDGIKKQYQVLGKFSRAYLFIDALVDYTYPLTSWDDVYLTINNIGGHLIDQESSLLVPPGESSRYLYDLQSISYYPGILDKKRKINKVSNADFFLFLQNDTKINIWVSVSSNRPGRVMKEVGIYYECLEGFSCNIQETK